MKLHEIWNQIEEFFTTNTWEIIWFFAVLLLGIIITKTILKVLEHIFTRNNMEQMAQRFLLTTVKVVFYLILVLTLLSMIGIQINGIITALSAVLLAIGLALENTIANFANGVIIIANKMFKKNDFISVGGVDGKIVDINFLFVTLNTTDNRRITVPNSTIINSSVYNVGANPTRRVDFTFSVAYETDVDLVKKVILEVMRSNGKVRLDPPPFCRLKTLNTSSIDFFSNCWCDASDYWDVYYDTMENVYNEFKRNGISVPFTQIEMRERTETVVMPYREEPLPERVEKVRSEPVVKNHLIQTGKKKRKE